MRLEKNKGPKPSNPRCEFPKFGVVALFGVLMVRESYYLGDQIRSPLFS